MVGVLLTMVLLSSTPKLGLEDVDEPGTLQGDLLEVLKVHSKPLTVFQPELSGVPEHSPDNA